MSATLTWLDLTASDRNEMCRVLDLFNESGTIDEMGLGSLRDAFSNALFPGTSTIQTRLRYFLFIPWIYQYLERRNVSAGAIEERSRKEEICLIPLLLQNNDTEGTIGSRSRDSLARLPSSIYWSGLVHWGIFQYQQSRDWYHVNFERLVNRRKESSITSDDPGLIEYRQPNWHPRLPEPPSSFPDEVSFAMTRDEGEFLQGRIEENCDGTLLAWLAREGLDSPQADYFWNDSIAINASAEIRETIELARRFSLHVEGIPLLYNLLLAERLHQEHDGSEEPVNQYRTEFSEWSFLERNQTNFDTNELWRFAGLNGVRVYTRQRQFIEHWSNVINGTDPNHLVSEPILRTLIANRERQLKGNRARLENVGRLLAWNGGVGVGRMDFRWYRVRQLLTDLHLGLSS